MIYYLEIYYFFKIHFKIIHLTILQNFQMLHVDLKFTCTYHYFKIEEFIHYLICFLFVAFFEKVSLFHTASFPCCYFCWL
jgi:hypothetical protein